MTRTTPELAPPSPNFRATPTGGRLATTYDLACNRPHTRRIFSGIGFRTCDPPTEVTTRPPRPPQASVSDLFAQKLASFFKNDKKSRRKRSEKIRYSDTTTSSYGEYFECYLTFRLKIPL
ncbi:hypothetical protein AVEN_51210-1 [Araneus ventricosus]|uniref:Uncharacterized protein n=1 Tax=Araneus ventricosus TaxID=182803 RepID=A0A4Y2JIS6_ARAVE|nr:hypothetical protein AVEN_51210-1 [Araneus ventricosus]